MSFDSYDIEARFFCELSPPDRAAKRVLVVGLDLDVDASKRRPGVHLLRADARALPFRDGTFDSLYCYHVLEHVPGPDRAVAEAHRVVRPPGFAFFGTPNRARLVGYLGGRATTLEKLRWNLADWGKRLTGRWSNELGAHAGFEAGELARMLGGSFRYVRDVSLRYYARKYPGLTGMWSLAFRTGLGQFLAPSVYFVAEDVPPSSAVDRQGV